MSRIATSAIFLTRPYIPADVVSVEDVLIAFSDKVKPTKKGRFWELEKEGSIFEVDVRKTDCSHFDHEEDFLALDLTVENTPEVITILSNNVSSKTDENFKFVSTISNEIAKRINGITNGAKISS